MSKNSSRKKKTKGRLRRKQALDAKRRALRDMVVLAARDSRDGVAVAVDGAYSGTANCLYNLGNGGYFSAFDRLCTSSVDFFLALDWSPNRKKSALDMLAEAAV